MEIESLNESFHELQAENYVENTRADDVPTPNFTCEICGKSLFTSSGLKRHIQNHNNNGSLKCLICERSFTSKGHYEGHVNSHHNIRPYKCEKCTSRFTYRSALFRHTAMCRKTEAKEEEATHKCQTCNATFNRKDSLKDHLRGKHGITEKRLTCNVCGTDFKWRSSLHRHMKNKGHAN